VRFALLLSFYLSADTLTPPPLLLGRALLLSITDVKVVSALCGVIAQFLLPADTLGRPLLRCLPVRYCSVSPMSKFPVRCALLLSFYLRLILKDFSVVGPCVIAQFLLFISRCLGTPTSLLLGRALLPSFTDVSLRSLCVIAQFLHKNNTSTG